MNKDCLKKMSLLSDSVLTDAEEESLDLAEKTGRKAFKLKLPKKYHSIKAIPNKNGVIATSLGGVLSGIPKGDAIFNYQVSKGDEQEGDEETLDVVFTIDSSTKTVQWMTVFSEFDGIKWKTTGKATYKNGADLLKIMRGALSKAEKAFKAYDSARLDKASMEGEDRFKFNNGKRPSGTGMWVFGKTKDVDMIKGKKNVDYFEFSGSYAEAKKAALRWANKMGYISVYVQS